MIAQFSNPTSGGDARDAVANDDDMLHKVVSVLTFVVYKFSILKARFYQSGAIRCDKCP